MTLQDIFDQLETGEFSTLGIIGDDGKLETSEQAKVVRHINLAVADLYSRFNLANREFVLEIQDEVTLYKLSSDYADSNLESVETKYIKDTAEDAFTDDLTAVTEVFDGEGDRMGLNDAGHEYPISTPTYNVLKVTGRTAGELLEVHYKAKHTVLPEAPADASALVLGLPSHFLQAVLYYVGYRINSNRLKEGSAILAANMKQMYEQECLQMDQWGLTNAHAAVNKAVDVIDNEGWA